MACLLHGLLASWLACLLHGLLASWLAWTLSLYLCLYLVVFSLCLLIYLPLGLSVALFVTCLFGDWIDMIA